MGKGQSKPAYKPEKLGTYSGIDIIPRNFGEWWQENFYMNAGERFTNRLITERQEQIRDQFTDDTRQAEYDIFMGLWAKDGEFTKSYTGSEEILTSDKWPESVKEVSGVVESSFNIFRANHNAVLRTYKEFRDEHGVVSNPHGLGDRVRPRCARDGGTCPEWNKSFREEFEGDLPVDIRQLEGEGLDRFNRYMMMRGEENGLAKAMLVTDMIPFVGGIVRSAGCATARDAEVRADNCKWARNDFLIDGAAELIGPLVRVAGAGGRAVYAAVKGGRVAAGDAVHGATDFARGLEGAGIHSAEGVGEVAPRLESDAERVVKPEPPAGVSGPPKSKAPAQKPKPTPKTRMPEPGPPKAPVPKKAPNPVKPPRWNAQILKAGGKYLPHAALIGAGGALAGYTIANDDGDLPGDVGWHDDTIVVGDQPIAPDVKSHIPGEDDHVSYNPDLEFAAPDDLYTVDVSAGMHSEHMLETVLLVALTGATLYYAYRRMS